MDEHSNLLQTLWTGKDIKMITSQGTNFHACEIMVIHDSSNATHEVYGSVHTNGELFTTTVDTNSGNVRLKVTPSSSNSTVFKISRNLLTV